MVASVITLGREHVTEVVSVLAEAFHGYPVMRYVLGASDNYAEHLDRLITFFVMARVLRGGTRRAAPGSRDGAAAPRHGPRHVRARRRADGVSLTTEVASNLALYVHFGYEIVGSAQVGTAFTTWTMVRPDGAP